MLKQYGKRGVAAADSAAYGVPCIPAGNRRFRITEKKNNEQACKGFARKRVSGQIYSI
jgi:hypothetical protein